MLLNSWPLSHQNTPVLLSPVSLAPFPGESTQPLTNPEAPTPKMRAGIWSTRALGTHDSAWAGAWPSSNTDAYVGGTAKERSAQGSLQLTGVRPKACSCHNGTFALAADMAHINPFSSPAWLHPSPAPQLPPRDTVPHCGGVTENGSHTIIYLNV